MNAQQSGACFQLALRRVCQLLRYWTLTAVPGKEAITGRRRVASRVKEQFLGLLSQARASRVIPGGISGRGATISHDPLCITRDAQGINDDASAISCDRLAITRDTRRISRGTWLINHDPRRITHDIWRIVRDTLGISRDTSGVIQ